MGFSQKLSTSHQTTSNTTQLLDFSPVHLVKKRSHQNPKKKLTKIFSVTEAVNPLSIDPNERVTPSGHTQHNGEYTILILFILIFTISSFFIHLVITTIILIFTTSSFFQVICTTVWGWLKSVWSPLPPCSPPPPPLSDTSSHRPRSTVNTRYPFDWLFSSFNLLHQATRLTNFNLKFQFMSFNYLILRLASRPPGLQVQFQLWMTN